MFTKNNEQFAEATNNTVDTAYAFLQTSLESIEKIAKLQVETSKKILDEASQTMKYVAGAANSKDIFDKVNQLATNTIGNNICNCKDAYEVFADTQSKLGKVFASYFNVAQQGINSTIENFTQFSPTKNSFATESFKTLISNANQALNNFTKVSAQVADFTTNNIKTAATANAVKKSNNSTTSENK